MLATLGALALTYGRSLIRVQHAIYYVATAAVITFVLMVNSSSIDIGDVVRGGLQTLAKSGDPEEITSATGRAGIWAKTVQLIQDRPILGYGAATSKVLLQDFSGHAHNLVLAVALSTGVCGGLAVLMMCLSRVGQLFRRYHPMADSLALFILINGLFEDAIFPPLGGMPTMIWVVSLVWFQIERVKGGPAVTAANNAA
jgi:O-antigen ligase